MGGAGVEGEGVQVGGDDGLTEGDAGGAVSVGRGLAGGGDGLAVLSIEIGEA